MGRRAIPHRLAAHATLRSPIPKGEIVSPHPRPMSRRVLLQSAAVAPVLAVAQKLAAGEMTEAEAEDALVHPRAELPKNEYATVKQLADAEHRKQHGSKSLPEVKFQCIALSLWRSFVAGAGNRAPIDGGGVFVKAWHYKTGEKLIEHLGEFDENTCEDLELTSLCAYRCGVHAHTIAARDGEARITPPIYEAAWERTKTDMDQKKARVAELVMKRAQRAEHEVKIEPAYLILANGC